jgi:hypothetical protein
MPRSPAAVSIEDILRDAASTVVVSVMKAIAPAVREAVAAQAPKSAGRRRGTRVVAAKSGSARRPPRKEMTKWVADNRARRVPIFVIEATGLDTKKKIVAKYGENAKFDKGKPLPTAKTTKPVTAKIAIPPETETKAARMVKAKPPSVRKTAAAK